MNMCKFVHKSLHMICVHLEFVKGWYVRTGKLLIHNNRCPFILSFEIWNHLRSECRLGVKLSFRIIILTIHNIINHHLFVILYATKKSWYSIEFSSIIINVIRKKRSIVIDFIVFKSLCKGYKLQVHSLFQKPDTVDNRFHQQKLYS